MNLNGCINDIVPCSHRDRTMIPEASKFYTGLREVWTDLTALVDWFNENIHYVGHNFVRVALVKHANDPHKHPEVPQESWDFLQHICSTSITDPWDGVSNNSIQDVMAFMHAGNAGHHDMHDDQTYAGTFRHCFVPLPTDIGYDWSNEQCESPVNPGSPGHDKLVGAAGGTKFLLPGRTYDAERASLRDFFGTECGCLFDTSKHPGSPCKDCESCVDSTMVEKRPRTFSEQKMLDIFGC